MIYTEENIKAMTGHMKDAATMWVEAKVDELFGKGSIVAVYIKRGFRNYLISRDEAINKGVAIASMFAKDEDGKIDTDAMMEDAIEAFRQMERRETYVGGMKVEYGQGEILVSVPHGIMYDVVFGRLGTIRITAEDLSDMKDLMKE